ncbi:TetR/AcrR family transcriptional regulator [Nocardia sp. NPDC051321]|uniref:SbtR family transcriptional regulator n=1 Tax=Nocardia sp. NPDC051321 TaxID=3364323 RepID=UPI0037A5F8F3
MPAIRAVIQQRVDRLAKLAADHLDAPDPGAAFFGFCTEVVASSTPGNEALCELMQSDDGWPRALLMGAGARFQRALGALLLAAQRQGAVRTDIEVSDVLAIFTGCVAIQRLQQSKGQIDRTAAIVLDAMRATPGLTNPVAGANPRNEWPERNETGEQHCPICDTRVRHTGTGRRPRYCSAACRQKAHRQRAAVRRA